MDIQIAESNSNQIQTLQTAADAMRGYIINAAQNLNDENLLRLLYIMAVNLEAIDQ